MNRAKMRFLTSGLAALLMVGAVSTAQAGRIDPQHTRYRYFQDLSVTGQFPGQIVFGLLYKENRKGEFTPRDVVSYHLRTEVNCNPGGQSVFDFGGNAFAKYAYFIAPLTNGGHFSHRFEDQFENPQFAPWKGGLSGTVLKRLKRGGRVTRTARVDGTFAVEDWDPYGLTGIRENCTSSASSYSATTCKRWMSSRSPNYDKWKRWKVPVCSQDPW